MLDVVSWKIEGNRANHEVHQKISILNKYKYFLTQEWLCESIRSIDIQNQLDPTDQQAFNFNLNTINWKTYIRLCVYSIKKYLLNQRVEQFKPQNVDLLSLESNSYFSDITWALK